MAGMSHSPVNHTTMNSMNNNTLDIVKDNNNIILFTFYKVSSDGDESKNVID